MIIYNKVDFPIIINFDFTATILQLPAIRQDKFHSGAISILSRALFTYRLLWVPLRQSHLGEPKVSRRHASSTAYATFAAICYRANHEIFDQLDYAPINKAIQIFVSYI